MYVNIMSALFNYTNDGDRKCMCVCVWVCVCVWLFARGSVWHVTSVANGMVLPRQPASSQTCADSKLKYYNQLIRGVHHYLQRLFSPWRDSRHLLQSAAFIDVTRDDFVEIFKIKKLRKPNVFLARFSIVLQTSDTSWCEQYSRCWSINRSMSGTLRLRLQHLNEYLTPNFW